MDISTPDDSDAPSATTPIQDAKYFFEDGDCMFLVEGFLFKLHKLFLSRDPESMFRDMFSIPQGTARGLDPVSLHGDSIEEFRALCWVLYALPNEIHLQSSRDADIPRLAKVAKMCHKYTLPTFENWALEMIRNQCQAGSSDYLRTCPADVLPELMALALLSDSILLSLIEQNWMARVRAGELPWSSALDAGERHGRQRFLADVYYHLSQQLYATTLSPANPFSHLNLTDQQLLRLLTGHTVLSNFRYRLRQDQLPQMAGCPGHSQCTQIWKIMITWPDDSSDMLKALGVAQAAARSYSGYCPEKILDQADDPVRYFFPVLDGSQGGQQL